MGRLKYLIDTNVCARCSFHQRGQYVFTSNGDGYLTFISAAELYARQYHDNNAGK